MYASARAFQHSLKLLTDASIAAASVFFFAEKSIVRRFVVPAAAIASMLHIKCKM